MFAPMKPSVYIRTLPPSFSCKNATSLRREADVKQSQKWHFFAAKTMAKFRLKTDEFAVKNMVAKERKALKTLGFSLFSRVRTNSAKTVGVCDRILSVLS